LGKGGLGKFNGTVKPGGARGGLQGLLRGFGLLRLRLGLRLGGVGLTWLQPVLDVGLGLRLDGIRRLAASLWKAMDKVQVLQENEWLFP
jgi:hypothetical protein